MIDEPLRAAVEGRLGQRVSSVASVAGGDINDAFELRLASGSSVFLKTHGRAPTGMFETEARGLEFLREARAVRVPNVLGYGDGPAEPAFLLLEFVRSGPRKRGFDEELGRSLAALHRAGPASFGFSAANFIGRLPQSNRECPTWAEFYRRERLEPQLAAASGLLSARTRRDFERLFAKLSELTGEREPPARLHGDLWSGNLHVAETGEPCLIDPAVYGGHREMDLAMMRLFGGFSGRVFDAYEEAYPLTLGHRERVQLYQLYPLLVHLNLFGRSYERAVLSVLSSYV